METLMIDIPENVEVKTVKAVLKALGVTVKKGKKKASSYNPEFVEKILQGENDIKAGKGKRMNVEDLWK